MFPGKVVGGGFDYDSCHVTELNAASPDLWQDASVLCAEDPRSVFLTPTVQLGLVATLEEQIKTYVDTCKETGIGVGGFSPSPGRVCLAFCADDAQYYRAAAIREAEREECGKFVVEDAKTGEKVRKLMLTSNRSCWIAFIPTVDYSQAIDDTGKFVVFYPDYGFQEVVCRSKIIPIAEELMKTPFLANHCVLAGFDKDKTRQPTEVETALMASKLDSARTKLSYS